MRRLRIAEGLCGGMILLTVGSFAQTVNDPNLAVEQVITSGGSPSNPTAMAFLATNDILLCEKNTGRVRRVTNGALATTNALDLAVANSSEQGLLGMALDPQFASNQLVYLFYSRASSDGGSIIDQRISRFTWNGATLGSEQVLVTLPGTPGPNHDGGIILFGPPADVPSAQKLYAVIGDLNRNNQTENFASGGAADDSGCIIRVNPDGTTPSGLIRGPFFDVPSANASLQRMYAYGIRNSFGMDFDPITNALWDTENGTGDYDEINRVDVGFNSGWEDIMGPTGFPSTDETAPGKVVFGTVTGTYSDPEFSWRQTVAPTAIHFLRSANLGASYQNDCFVGCNNNAKLYRFELNPARTGFVLTGNLADTVLDTGLGDTDTQIVFGNGFSVATDIETGPDGNLYVCSYGNDQIYRIRNTVTAASDWQLFE